MALRRQHTEDPRECWCIPAVLLSPATKTLVHRWTFRDLFVSGWYNAFGWPPATAPGPLFAESVRKAASPLVH